MVIAPKRNMYQGLMQYFLIKKFINRISSKKNMNSKFNEYHFQVINDRSADLNLKLFKDNALQLKPMMQPSTLPTNPSFKRVIVRHSKKIASDFMKKLNTLAERIPLFYPESRFKLIWDGVMMIPRVYFMFMIPFDLSFFREEFMFS